MHSRSLVFLLDPAADGGDHDLVMHRLMSKSTPLSDVQYPRLVAQLTHSPNSHSTYGPSHHTYRVYPIPYRHVFRPGLPHPAKNRGSYTHGVSDILLLGSGTPVISSLLLNLLEPCKPHN